MRWLLAAGALLKFARGALQQQYLRTRVLQFDAIVDPFYSSNIEATETWTNKNQDTRLDSSVIVVFNEAIAVGAGRYITIQPAVSSLGTSSTVATTLRIPGSDVTISEKSIIINTGYQTVFSDTTVYTVSFDAGAVISSATASDVSSAFSVQFETGDFTIPRVVTKTPADGATAARTSSDIVLSFSENVQANPSITTRITFIDPFLFQPQQKIDCSAAGVQIDGDTVTISQPSSFRFAPCRKYQLVYDFGCFYDTSPTKNPVDALITLASYDFYTSCITAYSPAKFSINNLISTDVVLTFSEPMQRGIGNIVLTPRGEATGLSFAVTDTSKVKFTSVPPGTQVKIVGSTPPNYLCSGLSMQDCKGKQVYIDLGYDVIRRVSTATPAPSSFLPTAIAQQLFGDYNYYNYYANHYKFTLKAADLTPPQITIVSMYGISETVIRVTVRLDESGTTYCRAYNSSTFTATGTDVPTILDCTACQNEINSNTLSNFKAGSTYDSVQKFAQHEVDVTGLDAQTFYWVYCYSHDIELPTYNTVTSAQMLATQQEVRTLDTTPPTLTSFSCGAKSGSEHGISIPLTLSEAGRAYCKVMVKGAASPSINAVIAEGFYADVAGTGAFTILVDQITTGLGATGMESLRRKTDYDVYCWAQDVEGYPYYGPNGMATPDACATNPVTTLDLTPPEMTFIMAESISSSQIIITLQIDEGAKVWCAAWPSDPGITSTNYDSMIKGRASTCTDNKGRQCGNFFVYDLDDLEDTTSDGVTTQADYDRTADGVATQWKYNQDVDIIVASLTEELDYPYIYCFAEDDEQDGIGGAPNKMFFDSVANAGAQNVHTIKASIGTIQTLDESPPTFTRLSIVDPTAYNDRIIVTFSLNEAGTAYCRVTRSDSGETTLFINSILSANFAQSFHSSTAYITIDRLETSDSINLYEASQYDVYCWAKDGAVDTQGQPRPNYQDQDYVDAAVGTTLSHALTSPQGGKTAYVWVQDKTPPSIIYVSSEALSENNLQITLQLSEPGTVWCVPVLPTYDGAKLNVGSVTSSNYVGHIKGRSTLATFRMYVHQAYINVDVEVDKIETLGGTSASALVQETPYNIFCFADDDWFIQASQALHNSVNFDPVGQVSKEVSYAAVVNFKNTLGALSTLDLTPPAITINGITSGEHAIYVTLSLDEVGTAWCQAVRTGYSVPTILEILDTNFYNTYSGTGTSVVTLTGYDRPNNADYTYVTPLQLGTDYDVYCYADDDLCVGCEVTNGVSFAHVESTKTFIRTLDQTRPKMTFIATESIAADQILVTLQVDEGAKVWCAAWSTNPLLTSSNYATKIKDYAPKCQDSKGRQCGTFWVYDLDDMEDTTSDGLSTLAEYVSDTRWKYNQDVDIILFGLTEQLDYGYIYCYAEDDEGDGLGSNPNVMAWNAGTNNVVAMKTEIGTVQTLDESPPIFTKLSMLDPTIYDDRIIVTFKLNEAGTAYCRVTRSDSGETLLRINQILSANYAAEVLSSTLTGYITVTRLEQKDDSSLTLYQASQYDVYCWAKDDAVDSQGVARPNYQLQSYLETAVGTNINAPLGGKTANVWVKDITPPTMIFVSREALTQSIIQITLQLNEPGTVWCHPVLPNVDGTYINEADVVEATYIQYIKGRSVSFREYVHTPYVNVDVHVDQIDKDSGSSGGYLKQETTYNIFCFAEDDWKIEAVNSVFSPNFAVANTQTSKMTVGNGNEATLAAAESFKDAVGLITTLDLTPPAITIRSLSSTEDQITVTLSLDEIGTAWCQAVRAGYNAPTILEILDTNFYNTYTHSVSATTTVLIEGYDRPVNWDNSFLTPLVLGTDYEIYCYADDNLCQGCKVTNGVSFAHVLSTKTFIRTKDYTIPNMRYVAAESIAKDQILVTLQVDEGSKVWCAAWVTNPSASWTSASARAAIKAKLADCNDNHGRPCGSFYIYDLDDIEDGSSDGVIDRADYEAAYWKYDQDVAIIISGLVEEQDYPYIYCFAEDDETDGLSSAPNKMIFNTGGDYGPTNMYTIQQAIGTVQTLDESPPVFTLLKLQDPSAQNDRLVVTFQLNEAGTAYCRVTRSDSGETTLHINSILTASFSTALTAPTQTGYITVTKLEYSDPTKLYEASLYDVYCWAKDSAVDTGALARPNYQVQAYVDSDVVTTNSPLGGKTANVWVIDPTPPTIIVVSQEALSESIIQITLQLNEPGTIWCQIADKDSTSSPLYCRDLDVQTSVTTNPCYFETWIKGQSAHSTVFKAEVHVPYTDYDIDMDKIEQKNKAASATLVGQYLYTVWCFAEDDWAIQADYAAANSPSFIPPSKPNKVPFAHSLALSVSLITLDTTPPAFAAITGGPVSETQLQMTMTLSETGTIWCMPVRSGYAEPSVNEILQHNEYNAMCGTAACTVMMQGLQPKTFYDIWCYAEDNQQSTFDGLAYSGYLQRPNGYKFIYGQMKQIWSLDTTPPILTIISAESPIRTDIRVKIKMEEPGTVWCNSFKTGTSYGTITFSAVSAGGYMSYVGTGAFPGGAINTNVEVTVTDRVEQVQYDTYCTAQDRSILPTINKLTSATTVSTLAAIGLITTRDQTPPIFTKLGAKGINENTIMVTFSCNEACRSYCRVTRSDSGESTLSINRILKADFYADWSSGTQTIQLNRLEDDSSLELLERGTLYDTYCWIRDTALQYSCYAQGAGAICETAFKPNYQGQTYVDTAFGLAPPATSVAPNGGKMLHVRTPDTTPPAVIFVEAESTQETSITVTLQLDEPGTAYCKAYTTTRTIGASLFTDLTTGVLYRNTVTNYNNIYKNFDIKVQDLTLETKYYVYCVAEDDELTEGATTINPAPTSNNKAVSILTESTGRFTLDLTPPIMTVIYIASASETTATVTLQLDEPGTAWCKTVRDRFTPPTINQIIAASFYSVTTSAHTDFTVQVDNLARDTEYDMYCHARDGGTDVSIGTPAAGNPGNDMTYSSILVTKRDIHTMGDSTAPTVVSVKPLHQATSVSIDPIIEISFNEDIRAASSGSIVLTPDSGSQISLAITNTNTGVCSNGARLSIVNHKLTADFLACTGGSLGSGRRWSVQMAAGVLKDISTAGNAVAAFGASGSYYFNT